MMGASFGRSPRTNTHGDLYLGEVVLWVATAGHSRDWDPARDESGQDEFDRAETEVLDAIRDGRVRVFGNKPSGETEDIGRAVDWAAASSGAHSGTWSRPIVGFVDSELNSHARAGIAPDAGGTLRLRSASGVRTWWGVRIPAADVLAAWPFRDAVAPPSGAANPREVYQDWINRHAGKRPPSRDDDYAYMQGVFPKKKGRRQIPRKEIDQLRHELAPPDWKKPGPRVIC